MGHCWSYQLVGAWTEPQPPHPAWISCVITVRIFFSCELYVSRRVFPPTQSLCNAHSLGVLRCRAGRGHMAQLIMRISGEQPQLHYSSIRMHANLFFVTLLEGVIIYDHIYLRQLLLQTATGAIFMTQLRLNRVITYEKNASRASNIFINASLFRNTRFVYIEKHQIQHRGSIQATCRSSTQFHKPVFVGPPSKYVCMYVP